MPDNNVTRKLKQTRADLVEALNDLHMDKLVNFTSSIQRQRDPQKGKHIKITLEYITTPQD